MASRLKTYTAEIDGLNDWIVAAPNQKAALDAFGVRQNLFAQGLAGTTSEPALVEAAQASPGQPFKRRKGGRGKFTVGLADSDWTGALKAAAAGARAAPRKRISRARLDRAEAALEAAERAEAAELASLEAEVQTARKRLDAARARHAQKVSKAQVAVEAAAADYRKAADG